VDLCDYRHCLGLSLLCRFSVVALVIADERLKKEKEKLSAFLVQAN